MNDAHLPAVGGAVHWVCALLARQRRAHGFLRALAGRGALFHAACTGSSMSTCAAHIPLVRESAARGAAYAQPIAYDCMCIYVRAHVQACVGVCCKSSSAGGQGHTLSPRSSAWPLRQRGLCLVQAGTASSSGETFGAVAVKTAWPVPKCRRAPHHPLVKHLGLWPLRQRGLCLVQAGTASSSGKTFGAVAVKTAWPVPSAGGHRIILW